MTAHLDKISQKENKHIRALQCLDASRLGSHQIQREASLVSQREWEQGLQDPWPPLPHGGAPVPFQRDGARPSCERPSTAHSPGSQTAEQTSLAVPQSEKSDTI